MSKPKKQSSSSAAPPAPPPPQNEYFYENDFLRSQRVHDPAQNAYVTKSFSNPDEQAIEKKATGYISDMVNNFDQNMKLTPERIAEYGNAYALPQINALNESYNRAKGQADMAATSQGVRNSVGFGNYTGNVLERGRAQGLAEIAANRKMMELDLPNKMLMPYANQFNLINAALSGEQASMAQDREPAFQGSQAAQNAAQQNYQNQMAYWQARQPQQQQRGGLFSFFTGGA